MRSKQLFPLFAQRIFQLGANDVHGREAVLPVIGPAGVDDDPGVGEVRRVLLIRVHDRIERRAPAVVNDGDGALRVATRRHGPDDFPKVGGIDVIIHHHDESAMIGG